MNDSVWMSTPTGGVSDRRRPTPPAWHDDLMAPVVDPANRHRAWQPVKATQGAPGRDGMPLEDFPAFAREHWPTVRHARLDGTDQPAPGRRVAIPTPGGRGERRLGIPTGLDRGISQAIAQVLMPRFDPDFSASSCGFRPGRSAHGALRQGQRSSGEGYRLAVDVDREQCFDRVSHDGRLPRVARKGRDTRLLSLIGRDLRAGVRVGDLIQATEMGTAQGSPRSPWLANVLVDDLDQALERRGHRFTRSADDLRVLGNSARAGTRGKASLTRLLTTQLKLSGNESKSRGCRTAAVVFLGFTFRGTKRRWSDAAVAAFKHRIRPLPGRSWGVSMAYRLERLARSIRGWMHDVGLSDDYRPIPALDHWRRRIRLGYGQQWRRVRTTVRHLLALGTGTRQAILTALSSKGDWHLSKPRATPSGRTHAWLQRQGLISVRDLGLPAHGYACNGRVLRGREPPRADPQARWCGEGGLNTRPYPISWPLVA